MSFGTIFDVGANVGQSTLRFAGSFPHATVWAFARGYTIFELYGQKPQWIGEARLRFVDPVFCSATVAAGAISLSKSNGNPVDAT